MQARRHKYPGAQTGTVSTGSGEQQTTTAQNLCSLGSNIPPTGHTQSSSHQDRALVPDCPVRVGASSELSMSTVGFLLAVFQVEPSCSVSSVLGTTGRSHGIQGLPLGLDLKRGSSQAAL